MSNQQWDDFWPVDPFQYERHRPETTLLYQLIEQHWAGFQAMLAEQGRQLPAYVVQEFEVAPAHPCARDISESVHVRLPQVRPIGTRLPARSLRVLFATNPVVMGQVLTIINRTISIFLVHRAGMTIKSGAGSGRNDSSEYSLSI